MSNDNKPHEPVGLHIGADQLDGLLRGAQHGEVKNVATLVVSEPGHNAGDVR